MRDFSSLGDKIIGWVTAIGLVMAGVTTAYGYGWIRGVEDGKKDITVRLEPGTVCRINEDGSRLCRKPFASETSPVEMRRLKTYRRRAV